MGLVKTRRLAAMQKQQRAKAGRNPSAKRGAGGVKMPERPKISIPRTPQEWKELDRAYWSYSRLSAFKQCPRMYELTYAKRLDGISNFFAEFGSFVHKIYEMYERKELRRNQLLAYYKAHWDENVVTPAPYSEWVDFAASWHAKGCLAMKSPPSLREYEILGVEEIVQFKVAGEDAVGFIDLLLRRKKDGAIIIADHKSGKSVKILRNGKVSKTDAARFAGYRHQLYLYSIPVIEKYGRVDSLAWNFFNDGTTYSIPWQKEECDEAMAWAEGLKNAITKSKSWPRAENAFFCSYLCGQRKRCHCRH